MPPLLSRIPTPPPLPASGEASLVGELIAGRYQVLRPIGSGGMATVYEARCRRVGTRFAIKVARPGLLRVEDNIARLEREAWTTSLLDHPNCAAAVDCGRTPRGAPFFVMEHLPGRPLCGALGRPVAVSAVLDITRQLLLALDHCHAAGVVHRDVKPDNLMVDRSPLGARTVKLFDFGLARVLPGTPPPARALRPRWTTRREIGARITRATLVCGTPTYMAPELAFGKPATPQSDLYAVGVTMFYLLTGRRPIVGKNHADTMMRKCSTAAPTLDAVAPGAFSAELIALVARSLARDPQQRTGSAAAFIHGLDHVTHSAGRGPARAG